MLRQFTTLMTPLFVLAGCVSYEPAVLAPAVTLSAEEVSLVDEGSGQLLDFGLDTTLNESDSLFNIETLPGIRVRSVTANGPADAAGIQAGDIVLAVNGTETNHPDALLALQPTDSSNERQRFSFTVQRNTTVFEATVLARLTSENPQPIELYRVDPLATRAGYESTLVNIGDDSPMVAAKLVEIFPASPLPQAGFREGDMILALDGVLLNSAQDLVSRLNQDYELGSSVNLTRFDGEQVSEIEVALWDPGRRISRISLGPLFRYQASLDPDAEAVTILDFWLFSLYSYQQSEGERSHSLLGLINITSDSGELVEESAQ